MPGASGDFGGLVQHLLESAPVGVFLLDADCRVVWINAEAGKIFATGRDALVGFDKRELIRALVPQIVSDSEGVVRQLLSALAGEDVGPVECHMLAGEGRVERWIEHTLQRIEAGPLAGGWIEYCTDITDRKRAEAAAGQLELAVDDQRMILDNMAGFTYRHDVAGMFHYVSPSVERITGYTVDEWMKHYTAYLTDNPVNDKVVEFTEQTLSTGEANAPYKVEVMHKGGTRVMLEVTERPYFEGGAVAGIVGIALDMTEQQRLEDQMLQVQKLQSMGVLAGGVAHDFNNLLMAILGNAGLALENEPPEAPNYEHLREIMRTSRRAAEICQQMLAYSGKGTMRLEAFDLSSLVAEMASMLEVSISKKVRLVYDFGRDLPPAQGDPTQVRQVALNLITNASEAMGEESGEVAIRTGVAELSAEELKVGLSAPDPVPGTYVWLEVSDTGVGMDPATLARIYDPFFTTKFAGRGLGLSTVLGIMRGHEGAIRIWTKPGEGTRFRVMLPIATADLLARAATPQRPPQEPQPAAGAVLLIDDEPAVRKVGRRMLEKLGYEVLTADDGQAGLELYRERHAEIAFTLLDMTMPVMGGDEVFRGMRELVPDARVILVSGYDEGEAAKRMGKGCSYRFLQKPFGQKSLADAVGDLLAGS